MRRHREFIKEDQVSFFKGRRQGTERIEGSRIQVSIHHQYISLRRIEFLHKRGEGLLKEPLVKPAAAVMDLRRLIHVGHGAFFKRSPILRQSGKRIKTIETALRVGELL